MTLPQATLGAVLAGLLSAGVYELLETVAPPDDLWFAGLAAGLGLVTVPILIDLAVIDLLGRMLHRERHLRRVRTVLVVVSGVIGVVLVGWVAVRAGSDPFAGYAFVLLPVLVFALGVVALAFVILTGADEPGAAQ